MKTEIKIIEGCSGCPFADSGVEPGDGWWCHIASDRDGPGGRLIPTKRNQPPIDSPRWCPLRKSDHLVALKDK